MKIKVFKLIAIIYTLFVVIATFYTVFPWYLSTDARNMRENLYNFSSDMSKISDVKEINNSEFLKYPYPYAAMKLCDLSESWNSGYLTAVMLKAEKTNTYDLSGPANPYKTYQKLLLTANNSKLQVIYDMLSAQEGIVNPENELTSELLSEWNTQYSVIKEDSINAITYMISVMQGGFLFEIILLLPYWCYIGFKVLIKSYRFINKKIEKKEKK